ncbi:uncharacterized protein LOC105682954 [Athalia rosae]|uniref:uncharacterized protein LOC105682954 n=1 Tax=Athalia rosae TaxID=37344 RepID=UPI0020347A3A|nr:uncharacterized protein LOC105682954 [Athalia rosae]
MESSTNASFSLKSSTKRKIADISNESIVPIPTDKSVKMQRAGSAFIETSKRSPTQHTSSARATKSATTKLRGKKAKLAPKPNLVTRPRAKVFASDVTQIPNQSSESPLWMGAEIFEKSEIERKLEHALRQIEKLKKVNLDMATRIESFKSKRPEFGQQLSAVDLNRTDIQRSLEHNKQQRRASSLSNLSQGRSYTPAEDELIDIDHNNAGHPHQVDSGASPTRHPNHQHEGTNQRRAHSFFTGRLKVPLEVFTEATRITPSSPGYT